MILKDKVYIYFGLIYIFLQMHTGYAEGAFQNMFGLFIGVLNCEFGMTKNKSQAEITNNCQTTRCVL